MNRVTAGEFQSWYFPVIACASIHWVSESNTPGWKIRHATTAGTTQTRWVTTRAEHR